MKNWGKREELKAERETAEQRKLEEKKHKAI